MFALDLLNQFQSYNGTLLAAGKIYVYNLGRTQLATVYGDHNGATPIANPVVLDDQGMAEIYLNDAFNYTIVVYDAYGQEQFSRDIYPRGMGNGETIGTQLYEGVDPIVVNNNLYAISANTTKLGVQDPLYFVQDDEEGCIIGISSVPVPEGTMNESALGFENNKITGYNGSAFSAGNSYEAGSYVDITNNTISITGLTPVPADTASTGLVASVSADITGMIPDVSDMATQTWVNEQGFLTAHQDISNKLDTTAFSTVSGDFLTAIPSEYITENTLQSGLSSKLDSTAFSTVSSTFLTAHQSLDGLMSADLLEISDNKITGYNGTAFAGQGGVTGDFELSAGSGISIEDFPLEQKTVISVTAQGGNPEVEQAVIGNSATWDSVTAKADATAIPSLEGYATENWVTSQGYITNDAITGKQDITGMTAYATVESLTAKQDAGEYLSATDSANFLLTSDSGNFYPMNENPSGYLTEHQSLADYQTTAGMTAYQPVGDYLQGSDLSLNSYNKISAISGHELAGGGGGSVDFDYDPDGNISGINNTAIRYPSAEQLLPYPMEFVTNISDATGANILYVVTGE